MGHRWVAHLLLSLEIEKKRPTEARQAVVHSSQSFLAASLADVLEGVLGIKLLFLQLLEL